MLTISNTSLLTPVTPYGITLAAIPLPEIVLNTFCVQPTYSAVGGLPRLHYYLVGVLIARFGSATNLFKYVIEKV